MHASLPVLYSFRRCPYAMRARLAIAVSGIRCELREVVLRAKPPALLQVSPKGTVPVLVDTEGIVVEQSLDIMMWALRRNDPEHWLTPEQRNLPAMLDLVAECDGAFKYHLDRYKYPQRYDCETGQSWRDAAVDWLQSLETRLKSDAYLFGARPALADMAVAPFVRQFAHVDVEWFEQQPWPRLCQWLQTWKQSALFASVMNKYPAWQEGNPGQEFPLPQQAG